MKRRTILKTFPALASLFFLIGSLLTTALLADDANEEDVDAETESERREVTETNTDSFSANDQDPAVMLDRIVRTRSIHKQALFKVSPLKSFHDATDKWSDEFYEKTNVRVGTSVHHLFQWLTDVIPGEETWGTATDVDMIFRWDALNRGEPYQSSITFHLESRWDWGTAGPMNIAPASLGALGGTGNSFDKYVPVSIIRNFYWQTGTVKSKGVIRAGKITVDSIFGVSRHLTPNNACLSFVCTGGFSMAVPDSGLGAVGSWQVNDRFKIMAGISDANGLRYDWGDIGAGDFWKAIDFNVKIWPLSEKAGYSRFTLWQIDEADAATNAATGEKGWGYHILHEQELSRDGNLVSIWRYGRSMKGSSFFERQASAALVKYEPNWFNNIDNDSVGVAFSWMKTVVEGSRTEKELEIWYRFPLFPGLETTLLYQGIFTPAIRTDKDYASAWSIRFITSF